MMIVEELARVVGHIIHYTVESNQWWIVFSYCTLLGSGQRHLGDYSCMCGSRGLD